MQARSDLEVREVRPDELGPAAALLARGMRDNPTHVKVFGPDAAARERRVGALFGTVLPLVARGTLLGTYREGQIVGLAGVAEPGHCRPSGGDALRMLPRLLPRLGPGALARMGAWMGAWARRDPTERHWHLGPVAVDPPLQGQGIGSALLAAVCARLDRQRGLLYLETDKPENVRFYERAGFAVVAQSPVLGAPNWFMLRSPRR